MEPTFDDLINILKTQEDIYKNLLALGEMKQAELVKGGMEEIDAFTKSEEALIYQAGRTEEERIRCSSRLAMKCELQETATLSDLIALAPEEKQEELRRLHESMSIVLKELEKLGKENMELIKQALRIVNFGIETISQEPKGTYTSESGEGKKGAVSRILDKRV